MKTRLGNSQIVLPIGHIRSDLNDRHLLCQLRVSILNVLDDPCLAVKVIDSGIFSFAPLLSIAQSRYDEPVKVFDSSSCVSHILALLKFLFVTVFIYRLACLDEFLGCGVVKGSPEIRSREDGVGAIKGSYERILVA
jgi:hypothetical protein